MVLYPWAGAEALSYGASTRGGRFLAGAEAAAPRLASSIMFWMPLKPTMYIWEFLIQVLLKPSLKDFEHHFTSM